MTIIHFTTFYTSNQISFNYLTISCYYYIHIHIHTCISFRISDSNTDNTSEWIKDQEKTFTDWINGHLKSSKHQMTISDLRSGLKDGLVLIELMKTVAPESIQFIR